PTGPNSPGVVVPEFTSFQPTVTFVPEDSDGGETVRLVGCRSGYCASVELKVVEALLFVSPVPLALNSKMALPLSVVTATVNVLAPFAPSGSVKLSCRGAVPPAAIGPLADASYATVVLRRTAPVSWSVITTRSFHDPVVARLPVFLSFQVMVSDE